jgi:hypothetical protein
MDLLSWNPQKLQTRYIFVYIELQPWIAPVASFDAVKEGVPCLHRASRSYYRAIALESVFSAPSDGAVTIQVSGVEAKVMKLAILPVD